MFLSVFDLSLVVMVLPKDRCCVTATVRVGGRFYIRCSHCRAFLDSLQEFVIAVEALISMIAGLSETVEGIRIGLV